MQNDTGSLRQMTKVIDHRRTTTWTLILTYFQESDTHISVVDTSMALRFHFPTTTPAPFYALPTSNYLKVKHSHNNRLQTRTMKTPRRKRAYLSKSTLRSK
jgi:hypothetical protein